MVEELSDYLQAYLFLASSSLGYNFNCNVFVLCICINTLQDQYWYKCSGHYSQTTSFKI